MGINIWFVVNNHDFNPIVLRFYRGFVDYILSGMHFFSGSENQSTCDIHFHNCDAHQSGVVTLKHAWTIHQSPSYRLCVSIFLQCFPIWIHIVPLLSHRFSHMFPHAICSHMCPNIFHRFPMGFPMVFHGFPMVFPWFSHGFPMVFPWFPHGFPMVFPWFSTLVKR